VSFSLRFTLPAALVIGTIRMWFFRFGACGAG